MVGAGADAMLGKVAIFDQHLALATGLVAAADRFDLDAHAPGCFEQRHPDRDIALAAQGLEDDPRCSGLLGGYAVGCSRL